MLAPEIGVRWFGENPKRGCPERWVALPHTIPGCRLESGTDTADVVGRMDKLLAEGDRAGVVEALFRSLAGPGDFGITR